MPRRLAEKLRFLRIQRQLSQVEVAQSLGLASSSHLSYLEAGHKAPSLGLLVLLANYYRVKVDYLLRDDLPVEPPMPQHTSIDAEQWPQHLAAQVAAHRRAAAWTQSSLAVQLLPLTQAFISQLEAARKAPSVEIALRIAEVFCVPVDELLFPL